LLVEVLMYAGERDLLEARMKTLDADLTIVVEGMRTFTGQPKDYGKPQLPKELDSKMEYLPIDIATNSNPWINEFAQRRAGFTWLYDQDLADDTVVSLFDVDEIPCPTRIRETTQTSAWNMAKYQLSARWYQQHELTGVSGLLGDLKGKDVAELRARRATLPIINAGWHLSSFMTEERLKAKWSGFSHQELVRPNMGDWVSECWHEGKAVENGIPMLEQEGFGDIPEAILQGPDYWLRGRVA
jgi:hypothetical protein